MPVSQTYDSFVCSSIGASLVLVLHFKFRNSIPQVIHHACF